MQCTAVLLYPSSLEATTGSRSRLGHWDTFHFQVPARAKYESDRKRRKYASNICVQQSEENTRSYFIAYVSCRPLLTPKSELFRGLRGRGLTPTLSMSQAGGCSLTPPWSTMVPGRSWYLRVRRFREVPVPQYIIPNLRKSPYKPPRGRLGTPRPTQRSCRRRARAFQGSRTTYSKLANLIYTNC